MTSETAQAIGDLADRLTRPLMTAAFSGCICYIAIRSITNISADQFVGIVQAVVLFWFASRAVGQSNGRPTTPSAPPPSTTTPG